MVTYLSGLAIILVLFFWTTKIRVIKHNKVFPWLMLIPFAVLLIYTVNNPDYQVYKQSFETGDGPYYETGIRIIADILRIIRLNDYRVFLLLTALLVCFAFRLWSRKVPNVGIVILLYSLFIMYYDVIQIRFSIAMMLLLISLYYSIDHKWIPAVFFALASVFFHRLAVLPCLIILYISLVHPRKDYLLSGKETSTLVIVGLYGGLFSRKLVDLIASKWSFFSRITFYMTKDVGYDSLIIWVGYEIFLIVSIYFLGYRSIIEDPWVDIKTKESVNKLFRFMLFGITISGFMLFVEEFNRMYRLFYLVGYLLFAIMEKHMNKTNRIVLLWTMVAVSVLFMMVAMMRGINFDLYW